MRRRFNSRAVATCLQTPRKKKRSWRAADEQDSSDSWSSDGSGDSKNKKARSPSGAANPCRDDASRPGSAPVAHGLQPAKSQPGTLAPRADSGDGPAAAPPSKDAERRARADAMLARLTAKLGKTTKPKKRLALQDKMLSLLPHCTPPQPDASRADSQRTSTTQSRTATSATAAPGMGHLPQPHGFSFKLQRTPKGAMPAPVLPSGPEEESRRKLRQQRFGDSDAQQQADDSSDGALLVASSGLGTSEALEKEYLRLTSLPLAVDVRPPPVLELALRRVKDKWLQRADYAAAAEQLKAIRQDLTVQHVRSSLTVDVYETHGRLALEADDLAEFRRCHGVLRQLYAEGLPGNPAEFEAYGLLYTQATAAARNTLAMELSRVPPHLLGHPYVRHAMAVCAAARSGNYARFTSLYDGAPRMSPYIMDRLLGQMRLWALQSTVSAFKPLPVPLTYLAEQLGLETEDEAADLAQQHGACVDRAGGLLDTRASAAQPLGPPRPSG